MKAALNSDKEVTNKLYERNFHTFALWCRENQLHPQDIDVYSLIRFLNHLQSRNRAFSTINNYKVAIIPVLLMADKHSETARFALDRIMKGMNKKQQRRPSFFPQWRVDVVLDYLNSNKFEPLASKPEYIMLAKTVFLTIMASGRRPSDLAGLVIRDMNDWLLQGPSSAIFHYHPTFRPKNKSIRFFPEPVIIPAINPEDLQSDKSCPVRALKTYIHHTKAKRNRIPSYVFQPIVCGDKVKPGYISKVVKELIIRAHRAAGVPVPRGSTQARQTRKMASSLAYHSGAPLEDVVRSAGWSAVSTFIDHYLIRRPLPISRSMVAAGRVLQAAPESSSDSALSYVSSSHH